MSANAQFGVGRQTPGILFGAEWNLAAAERAADNLVENADAERRDAVALEVLELIIAPDQDDIGLERVQFFTQPLIACQQSAAMLAGGRLAVVGTPFLAHRLGPLVTGGKKLRLDAADLDPLLQHVRPVFDRHHRPWIVAQPQSQYLGHRRSPSALIRSSRR